MTNSIRHGLARHIDVILKFYHDNLKLFIIDDGRGCKFIKKGFGISGMEQRIKSLGGMVVYGSDGENGFNVHIEVPIKNVGIDECDKERYYMIKVIIADDQLILRESLKFIIEQDDEIEVLDCVGNGYEALKLCEQLDPKNTVLMDIMMPECNGIEGTRLIKDKFKDSIKVFVLTTFNDDENISKAINNGADGYILKDILPVELVLAVKSAAHGFGIFHQSAVKTALGRNKLITNTDQCSDIWQCVEKSDVIDLTDREKSIIRLIVDGKNNKEIALELCITEGTVKNVMTVILEKLKLRDRTQLAIYAIKNNLGK